jgi:Fe-S oxidoreductase
MNLRNRLPFLAKLSERLTGFAADRPLPEWRAPFAEPADDPDPEVVLLADTFNRHFEPENLADAVAVLRAAGLRVGFARAPKGRPLCCGRTYLSAGLVGEAKAEMARTAEVLRPVIERGGAVVGLEPSCLLTFRDEAPRLIDGWTAEMGRRVMLLEEYLAPLADRLPLKTLAGRALVHGHCHQKAANVMGPVEKLLRAIPGLDVGVIESSCCGMAGAFGYQAETAEVSRAMAELSLLPAVRGAPDATIVADGTSCRHQIADGTGRDAIHVATVLRRSLEAAA